LLGQDVNRDCSRHGLTQLARFMHERSISAKRRCYCSRFDCSGRASGIDAAVAGLVVCIRLAREVEENGRLRGIRPRRSGNQTRQPVEERGEDRLLGRARRQMDFDSGFQLDDAGGEFDQAQPQGVELRKNRLAAVRRRAGVARRRDILAERRYRCRLT
jgi:hypothetical protein